MSTIKQQKVAQEVVKNLTSEANDNAQQMLEKAGYSETVTKSPGIILNSEGVQKEVEKIKETMLEAFERKGITPAKVADKVNALLEAQRVVRAYRNGELEFEMSREDYPAISKGIDYALKIGIGGGYDQEKPSQGMPIPILSLLHELHENKENPPIYGGKSIETSEEMKDD